MKQVFDPHGPISGCIECVWSVDTNEDVSTSTKLHKKTQIYPDILWRLLLFDVVWRSDRLAEQQRHVPHSYDFQSWSRHLTSFDVAAMTYKKLS